jgi:hypothetical protein
MHKILVPLLLLLMLGLAALAGYGAGRRACDGYEVMSAAPAEARKIAFVRERLCDTGRCQTLWLGDTREDATLVAELGGSHEVCEEIAWASDGYRMGFLINGYQLRIFDAQNQSQVGVVDLLEAVGTPTSRIARGVTFSPTGAAVTFDDCPRGSSGCSSGLVAVR